MDERSDDQLLRDVAAGQEALRELLDRYFQDPERLAGVMPADADPADHDLQGFYADKCEELAGQVESFGSLTNFEGWLKACLRNTHVSQHRQRPQKVVPADDLPGGSATASAQIRALEGAQEAREKVARLYQEILERSGRETGRKYSLEANWILLQMYIHFQQNWSYVDIARFVMGDQGDDPKGKKGNASNGKTIERRINEVRAVIKDIEAEWESDAMLPRPRGDADE